ncbi:hypothetical protein KSP39_PZI019671 [Platanthera zijinensis]|uniref:DUF4218 domain-containing protein n=1 Tax=Platanthera zijinensis TaxID=2320716 RepID=A0AAP0B1R9_9ASPA
MVHLPIHLIHQIKLGGPVHFQWMYWMERYLYRLKSYVRNRSRLEGSIAEAYLADECLAFCSRYMHDGVKTRLNRYSGGQNSGETHSTFPFIQMSYPLGGKKKRERGKKNLKGEAIMLDNTCLTLAHRYTIFNCGDEEVEKYIK